MNTIIIDVPYEKRHLRSEIKQRHGKFNPATKTWSLPDNPENRQLADLIQKPVTGPTPEERVANVVTTAVELLNALRHRRYRAVEVGHRIVIESESISS